MTTAGVGALEQWPELVLAGGEPDESQVGLCREDRLQARADRGVIVEERDADHRVSSGDGLDDLGCKSRPCRRERVRDQATCVVEVSRLDALAVDGG
jgi:hypothetical protein